jgi:hypothetical protein
MILNLADKLGNISFPVALETVSILSIIKVRAVRKEARSKGTMMPPSYILTNPLLDPDVLAKNHHSDRD